MTIALGFADWRFKLTLKYKLMEKNLCAGTFLLTLMMSCFPDTYLIKMENEIELKISLSVQKIKTRCNEIWLDDLGLLRVKALQDAVVDLPEAVACFDAYRELGCKEKKKEAINGCLQ